MVAYNLIIMYNILDGYVNQGLKTKILNHMKIYVIVVQITQNTITLFTYYYQIIQTVICHIVTPSNDVSIWKRETL